MHRNADEIVGRLLQTAIDPLGFGRAMFFENHENRFAIRWEIDGMDGLRPAATGDPFAASLLQLPEPNDVSIGHAGDLCAPVVDVRNWYIFSALANERRIFGYWYADGHAAARPRPGEAEIAAALGSVTTAALQNALLFNHTQELASTDSLTGLLNRRAFDERIAIEIAGSRQRATSVALAIVDLDDLKKINDAGGHAFGDGMLCRLSKTLCEESGGRDVAARLAGDEFALLLVDTNPDLARAAVRRISSALRLKGIRCSIGVALYPSHAHEPRELLRAADQALYAVKAAGKNGFAFYSTEAPG